MTCAFADTTSRDVSTPRASSPSISLKRTARSTTTPLPMTGVTDGVSTPAGSRWRAYFSSPMTMVWPALLPPLYLTTKSTWSPSRSVALPLPSSPHWAPSSTIAGMTSSLPTTKAPLLHGVPETGCKRRGASCDERLLDRAELRDCFGVAVAQECRAPRGLVVLADGRGRPGEGMQRAQKTTVGLVRPRHRTVPLPAAAPQCIEPAVVAHPGVGVGLDDRAGLERPVGERRPCHRRGGEPGGDDGGIGAGSQRRPRLGLVRQQRRGRPAQQVVVQAHDLILPAASGCVSRCPPRPGEGRVPRTRSGDRHRPGH